MTKYIQDILIPQHSSFLSFERSTSQKLNGVIIIRFCCKQFSIYRFVPNLKYCPNYCKNYRELFIKFFCFHLYSGSTFKNKIAFEFALKIKFKFRMNF